VGPPRVSRGRTIFLKQDLFLTGRAEALSRPGLHLYKDRRSRERFIEAKDQIAELFFRRRAHGVFRFAVCGSMADRVPATFFWQALPRDPCSAHPGPTAISRARMGCGLREHRQAVAERTGGNPLGIIVPVVPIALIRRGRRTDLFYAGGVGKRKQQFSDAEGGPGTAAAHALFLNCSESAGRICSRASIKKKKSPQTRPILCGLSRRSGRPSKQRPKRFSSLVEFDYLRGLTRNFPRRRFLRHGQPGSSSSACQPDSRHRKLAPV